MVANQTLCKEATFTGSDGTALTTLYSGSIMAWSNLEVNTNGARSSSGTLADCSFPEGTSGLDTDKAPINTPNQWAGLTLLNLPTSGSKATGVFLRKTNSAVQTCYFFYANDNNAVVILKYIAGAPTLITFKSMTVNNSDVLVGEVYKDELELRINGTSQLTTTDTSVTSGIVGLASATMPSSAPSCDGFQAGIFKEPNKRVVQYNPLQKGMLLRRNHVQDQVHKRMGAA